MANYNKKRATIYIRTIDGKEYKYVKPTVTGNGILVSGAYEYAATSTLNGVGEVLSITILTPCGTNANYGVNLRAAGVVNTALTTAAHDTVEKVATAIAGSTYTNYIAYAVDATVYFVCKTVGVKTGANTLVPNLSGVTVVGGAMTNPVAGEAVVQAFTDYLALKALITGTGWLSFDIDTTNNTLNYYNSEEKETTVARPRKMVSMQIATITSLEISETPYNDAYP